MILTGRNPERLDQVAREVGALNSVAFNATDFKRLGRFFDELAMPIDHVMVTGPAPFYASLAEFDVEGARRAVDAHLLLPVRLPGTPGAKFAREGPCFSWAEPEAAGRRRGSRSSRRSRQRIPL